MKKFQSGLILFLVSLFAGGCATQMSLEEFEACIWGTSLAGAAVGGAVGNVGGAAAGTAGGAIIGAFICGPVGEAPAPAPEQPAQAGHFWIDDQDADGVRDGDDKCPFTPEGVAVDADGCELDGDGDGVPDYLDQCPDTPHGTVVDTRGCSYVIATLQNVHFAFDSATLTSEGKSILDRVVPVIKSSSSTNISVEGHT
ncbi:MAG: thrombospondin type 3 repeat-containing protein, partial [Gammaproteobacteria bacterium]|nr:thrombospondin type 3 repeat-containing protein [Gammaproteobacteria bacterium]